MPRKKVAPEEWIEVQEAAAIISANSGHAVSPDYVRLRASKGFIQMKKKDGRTNLYLKSDVEQLTVEQRSKRPGTSVA